MLRILHIEITLYICGRYKEMLRISNEEACVSFRTRADKEIFVKTVYRLEHILNHVSLTDFTTMMKLYIYSASQKAAVSTISISIINRL